MGNPIAERFEESENRSRVLEELGKSLQLMRKSVERYDEKV